MSVNLGHASSFGIAVSAAPGEGIPAVDDVILAKRGVHRQSKGGENGNGYQEQRGYPPKDLAAIEAGALVVPETIERGFLRISQSRPQQKRNFPGKRERAESRKEPPNGRLRPEPEPFGALCNGEVVIQPNQHGVH